MKFGLLLCNLHIKIVGGIILAGTLLIGNPISVNASLGDLTLKQGMTHKDVKDLQIALKKTNHFTYPSFTNYYGTYTRSAVIKFQKQNKLKATGVADAGTISLIKNKAAQVKTVASIKTFDSSVAKKLAGVRYKWGGTNPSTGFDCSGFVTYVMKQHGKGLPRTSSAIYGAGKAVTKSSLKPGDLLYYDTNNNGRRDISHVAIYLGNNTMIHSASVKVEYDSLSNSWWSNRYIGANRVL